LTLGDGSLKSISSARQAQRLTVAGRQWLSTWVASGVFPELKLVKFTSLAISSPN